MKTRAVRIVATLILLLFLSMIVSAVICRFHLKVTEYEQSLDGLKDNCRVVCLTDLHGLKYGRENTRLLKTVSSQHPDGIFVLGDMMDSDAEEEELLQFLSLMKHLRNIAPVFFTFGNHEMDYLLAGGNDLISQLEAQGLVVLWDSFIETNLDGNTVRIGGSLGHYYGYHWSKKVKKDPPDYAMEEEIGLTDIPAIVLLHMPETILMDSAVKTWTGDLYLSGHTHGGVIGIPGLGSLFAPTQGLFPHYDKGKYLVYHNRFPLIISAGLSGYDYIPRIFNLPEVCVVNLNPAYPS